VKRAGLHPRCQQVTCDYAVSTGDRQAFSDQVNGSDSCGQLDLRSARITARSGRSPPSALAEPAVTRAKPAHSSRRGDNSKKRAKPAQPAAKHVSAPGDNSKKRPRLHQRAPFGSGIRPERRTILRQWRHPSDNSKKRAEPARTRAEPARTRAEPARTRAEPASSPGPSPRPSPRAKASPARGIRPDGR
jgi:hypothetical protein